jgi:hypothetical protein
MIGSGLHTHHTKNALCSASMSSITPHSEFPIHHYRFLLVRHRLAPSYDTSAPLTLRNWLQLDHTLIPTFFLFFFFKLP